MKHALPREQSAIFQESGRGCKLVDGRRFADGVITRDQRFGMHGLKHRGVKGTGADKKTASGQITDSMARLYNHEPPRVEPADD